VSPAGEKPRQITRGSPSVESAFSWSPDGRCVAMVIDGSVGVVGISDGRWRELVSKGAAPVRPEACVFSPEGARIAYLRVVDGWNQIFTAELG
jgi:Tol biopolymer transport system component